MLKLLSIFSIIVAGSLLALSTPDLSKDELQSRYGLTPQNVVALEDAAIHYKDNGSKDAPVVLLLHGFGSSLQTWDDWSQKLELTYRVVRLDLPGFGLTGPSFSNDYSEGRDLKTLIQFVDKLGIEKMSVVGHSMGGKLAWSFAAAEPTRVNALVLMAPDGFPKPEDIGSKPYASPAIMGLIEFALPKYLVEKSIEPAFANADSLTPQLVNRYYDMLRAPGVRRAILTRGNQTVYTDPVPRLKAIQAPTLLIWGEADQMIPSSNGRNYESVLMRSKTVVLPKMGHLIQEEQPERGLAEVLSFLRDPSVAVSMGKVKK